MKKKLIFKYIIFIFLFSFNQVIAEECDLEFEIGDDASKAIFLYGEPQDESDGKENCERSLVPHRVNLSPSSYHVSSFLSSNT